MEVVCSTSEESVWCSTAGSVNMHKEFTVTFAEASQDEMEKRKAGRSNSMRVTVEIEN